MKLIALSGFARTGKDEAAQALAKDGWVRVSFADKLREFVYELNPLVDVEAYYKTVIDRLRISPSSRYIYVQDVIDQYGWDGYKESPYKDEIRRLLQRGGTDAGRKVLGDSIWVDALFNSLDEDGKYVFADCRFWNEADAVKNRGGEVVRIERTGVGPINDHISETALNDYPFDFYLHNDGTLEEFQSLVRALGKDLNGQSTCRI